ncbi:ABC transporter ATP-binding protein [Aestuariivirga sp. YIM B02566]|uniref:Sn-glycerol-3-phosphate ABC transporter ATP-binding protein UgpC n=1 Tax=Taklimakanibacter albus TaxID=2800327 RepID=A0ACC5RBA5_9HYPH|nr:sn-glycerol-3-phosphate ABC transporter ATP-binding protein UgpC [Aestuariivirga sp. YIM B02566]MBK1869884.1 sn-glycerol-3-phosphate ABC transporter ATP-binding protein UgpC [Aestuariivirga sp. YIM B02566]
MASISLSNIHKFYPNGYAAVRDVSLDIKDGEFMILLGPSGCGKSTTLRMIAGLETISKGDLHIGGARMNDIDPADRDVAIVFQNYALYPHMTVIDNLSFGLRLRGVGRSIIDQRVANIADMLGIGELLSRKPAQLSGGQRQRVALGRALVREPKAFLLDEPLSNLDAKLRSAMRTELIKLHRTLGTTIVHVTHDQVEAMTMGERICIMKDGVIVQVGAPMEVYRNPVNTFVAGFLASPPMNLLRGRLSAQSLSLDGTVLALPPALGQAFADHAERDVIAGMRPEDFHLKADAAASTVPVEVHAVTTEVLGPEVILVATVSGEQGAEIHIRCPRDFRAKPGEIVIFHYDVSQLQLFDPETTYALKRPVQI